MAGTPCCAAEAKDRLAVNYREHIRGDDQPTARLRGDLRDFAFDLGVGADGGSHEHRREDPFIRCKRL